MKLKIKLIDNWRKAYKLSSVRLSAVFAVLAGIYPFLSEMKAVLPEGHWVVSALFAVVILARVISIKPVDKSDDDSKG